MQFEKTVKKIGTLLVGTAMMGSVLAGGALAANLGNYPAPFATSDDFASTIVVGATASTADVVGAINIAASLAQAGAESQEVSVSCTGGVTSVDNGAKIETSSKKLRFSGAEAYGTLNKVKASLTANDLDLLKKYTVSYADGTTTTINQVLTLYGNTNVTFNEEDNAGETVDSPRMVLRQDSSANLYQLEITSPAGLDINQSSDSTSADYKSNAPGLAGQDIQIMGKTFTVGTDSDITSTKLVLYGGGEEKSLTAGGDAITFTLDGEQHTIQMTSWTGTGTSLKGVFLLDGVTYEKADNTAITVNAETNSQVTIKKVSEVKMPSVSGGAATESATATLFIGSDKLTLEDGQPVVIGDDSVTGSLVAITADGSKMKTITVTYSPDETLIAAAGEAIADPIFGAVDFVFAGLSEADKADSKEEFKMYKSSNKAKLKFSNNAGTEYNIDLKTITTTGSGVGPYTWTLGGTAGTQKLWVAQAATDVTKGSSFFISDGTDSYVLKYKSISTSDKIVTLEDVGSGEEIQVGYTLTGVEGAGTLYLGSATFTVSDISITSEYHLTVADADQGTGGTNGNVNMVTKNGANFIVFSDANAPGVTYTETDDQSDTDKATINITVAETTTGSHAIDTVDVAVTAASGNGGLLGATTYSILDSNVYDGVTRYGTYVVDNTDADSIQLYYPDEQVTANVYVMKAGVAAPSVSSTGTTTTATASVSVPALSSTGVAVLDTEAESYKSTSNLILVGGPAVNKLVAELSSKTRSIDEWRTQTVAGVYDYQGQAYIEVIDDAFSTGNAALVVAGFDAADTQAACSVLQNYANYADDLADKTKVKVVGSTVSEIEEVVAVEEEVVEETVEE